MGVRTKTEVASYAGKETILISAKVAFSTSRMAMEPCLDQVSPLGSTVNPKEHWLMSRRRMDTSRSLAHPVSGGRMLKKRPFASSFNVNVLADFRPNTYADSWQNNAR